MRTKRCTTIQRIALLVGIVFGVTAKPAAGYLLDDRWSRTATNGSGLSMGDPTTLTWGLVDDGVTISGNEGSSASDLVAFLNAEIGTSDVWLPLFEQSYGRWGEISGLTLVHEPNNSSSSINSTQSPIGSLGSVPDMRIGGHSIDGSSGQNTLAYNYYPDNGDMVIDTDNASFYGNTSNNYRALRNTLMHEIGHGIGIEHVDSDDAAFLLEPNINTSFDGPQLDDIRAAHRMYGDVWEKNGGNNVFSNAVSLGNIISGDTTSIGTDADDTVVAASDIDFVSIDDNSDIDFFSFTVEGPSLVDVTLTPKGPTFMQGAQDEEQNVFDTSARNDLTLRIYDTNGTSLLAEANEFGLGASEVIADLNLPVAGTYYAQITGVDDTMQLYQLDVAPQLDLLPGDVNLDGVISTGTGDPATDDVAAFVAGWKTVQAEDDTLTAWMKGDLNFDRMSNLADAYLLHEALASAGLTSSVLAGLTVAVPEPTTASMLLLAIVSAFSLRRSKE